MGTEWTDEPAPKLEHCSDLQPETHLRVARTMLDRARELSLDPELPPYDARQATLLTAQAQAHTALAEAIGRARWREASANPRLLIGGGADYSDLWPEPTAPQRPS